MARDRERESVLRTRTGNRASCTRFAETGSQSGVSDCGAGRHTQQNGPYAALPRRPAHIQCKVEASGWCFDESPHLTKVSGELGIIADEFVARKTRREVLAKLSSSEPRGWNGADEAASNQNDAKFGVADGERASSSTGCQGRVRQLAA